MSISFTSKEAKSISKAHKENLKKLNNGAYLPNAFENQLKDKIADLNKKNFFQNNARSEIVLKMPYKQEMNNQLISALNRYLECKKISKKCADILYENQATIEKYLSAVSAGTNVFSRLFSSTKKIEDAEKAFDFLVNEKGLSSDYWSESRNLLKQIDDVYNIPFETANNDFNNNIDSYLLLFRKYFPKYKNLSSGVPEFEELISFYEDASNSLKKQTENIDKLKSDIKDAAEKMAMVAVLEILRQMPVEEVNRDKRGIRVKALRDAGYSTIADIYAASQYHLSSTYGISQDVSYTLKTIAKQYATEARKNAKIKISADNKTKEATKVVSLIFHLKQYLSLTNTVNETLNKYKKPINSSISKLKEVGDGVNWFFSSANNKESIIEAYNYLSSQKNGDYKKDIDYIVNLYKKIKSPSQAASWDDFTNDSVSYFNILEEIVPGLLGNDDKLYGLPEELAREIQEECFFPDGLNCELRRYQEWGVKYILHQERVLLGDEMGLGKTVQAIATMVSLRNTGATHFIVVCPSSVLPNWCKEIVSKSKLRVTKVHGNYKRNALNDWIKHGGVAVTTFETTGIFKFEDDFKFDLLIVDEAHFIKNEGAVRTKNTRELGKHSSRILFMTGTPLENKVDEMISLIDVLQPNMTQTIKNIAFMSAAPQFREKVAPVYYRRKRDEVLSELPDLIESKEWCTLSDEEEKLYENEVLNKSFMGARRLSWNVDDLNKSCKAKRMLEIINEATEEGRKVLIFSFFLETISKIHDFLGDRCLNPINGRLSPQRRQEIIDEFNESPAGTVLCAQIQSGGTGLNIQAASVVIICEPQFKPSIENQAISRAYRMGQVRNVLVYRLLCEKTIDEKLTNLLEDKQRIFDAFADKSVAASKVEKEVDDTTFTKIIEEEIERIKEKNKINDQPSE